MCLCRRLLWFDEAAGAELSFHRDGTDHCDVDLFAYLLLQALEEAVDCELTRTVAAAADETEFARVGRQHQYVPLYLRLAFLRSQLEVRQGGPDWIDATIEICFDNFPEHFHVWILFEQAVRGDAGGEH